ncbi:MAG: SDR family NAD(P)-dependent oxidoreductase [Desulfitobacterium sp.]
MASNISMKTVVITGSTRGVGLCMAKEFLKSGCNVTVSGRSEKSFELAKQELAEFSDKILYVSCNVRVKEELEKLWQESAQKWGRVDYWINNAGQNVPHEFAYDTEPSYVEAVIDTNIKGMIFGSQVAVSNMLSQGSGQVWNMEGLGSNGMIQIKTILYGTTKSALTYFTKGLAKELEGKPVLVGRLSPGMMLTDFITKTPDGEKSPVIEEQRFKKIFNILADKPETVAAFFVPQMLQNTKNDAHIVWLTRMKAMRRFATASFNKRELI